MLRTSGSQTLLGRFIRWYSQLNPLLSFGLKFCLVFGPCEALTVATWSERPIDVLLTAYAHITSWVLVLFGQNSHVDGSTIFGPMATLSVFRGCDALDPILVLCAGVVAYPASWRNKMLGLLLGVPALFVMNVVRILSLYIIRLKAPTFFEPMHLQIWPVVFVIMAGVLWLAWVRWTVREGGTHAAA
jgi:exosortase H (IPTLxxWG-CTERM-specific)